MWKRIAIVMLIILICTNNAYANGGPTVIDSTGGYHIVPPGDNNIQISREDIVYNINDNIKDSEKRFLTRVNVKYFMENTNIENEEYSIAFPLNFEDLNSSLNDVKVIFDGKDIEVKVLLIDGPISNLQFEDIVNELNNRNETKTLSSESSLLRIAIFKLTFQPKTEHILEVSYYEHSKLIRERKFLDKYSEWMPEFSYFLEPAKYWASFKDLHITINVPEGYFIEKNTISGFKQTDNQYNYYSKGLPDANLIFSLDKTVTKKPLMDIAVLKNYGIFILIFCGALIAGSIPLIWRHLAKNRHWKEKYRKL